MRFKVIAVEHLRRRVNGVEQLILVWCGSMCTQTLCSASTASDVCLEPTLVVLRKVHCWQCDKCDADHWGDNSCPGPMKLLQSSVAGTNLKEVLKIRNKEKINFPEVKHHANVLFAHGNPLLRF